MSQVRGDNAGDDAQSEFGGLFETAPVVPEQRPGQAPAASVHGVVRDDSSAVKPGFGKGAMGVDGRKYRYDVMRARGLPSLAWGASKVDRMDPSAAGDMLHSIHCLFGIDKEREDRLRAFDKSLWWAHTVNGASQLQVGRGSLEVDGMQFDIAPVVTLLGVDVRRFFRAYADDVAENNMQVLRDYDPYDPVARERHGQLMQIATARGLSKYPHLSHDSAEAGTDLSQEERNALLVSKRYYPALLNSDTDKKLTEGASVDAAGLA